MKKFLIGFAVVLFTTTFILYINKVDNNLSEADKYYVKLIMQDHEIKPLNSSATFEEQIRFIKRIQNAVLATAPINQGLPEGLPREPEHLYKAGVGLCYDRSRVIEKVLRYNNLNTRHIAVYSLKNNSIPLIAFISPGVESHALSEVKTVKGWMFIDSNDRFIGLDRSNLPISMKDLKSKGFYSIDWNNYNNNDYKVVYREKFTFLYGLYSRHGKFYPPFNFIPDINWPEFLQNLYQL